MNCKKYTVSGIGKGKSILILFPLPIWLNDGDSITIKQSMSIFFDKSFSSNIVETKVEAKKLKEGNFEISRCVVKQMEPKAHEAEPDVQPDVDMQEDSGIAIENKSMEGRSKVKNKKLIQKDKK